MNGAHDQRTGMMAAFAAFSWWGLTPIYFRALNVVEPLEVILHRIFWAIPVMAAYLLLRDGPGFWRQLMLPLRDLLILFVTGALDNISVVIRHTIMQMITPDEMRGRVSAINSMFIGASNELGGFESGLLAKLTTPVISVVAGGVGTIVVVAATALASPRLRRFGALESVSDEKD